jgi:hypothetical protein
MSRLSKIKEKTPELLSNPDVVQLAEEIDVVHNIKTLHDTEGGKQLVKLLIKDTINAIHRLRGGYQTMSHMELVAMIALMDTYIATAKLLIDAKDVMEVLDVELEEALRE